MARAVPVANIATFVEMSQKRKVPDAIMVDIAPSVQGNPLIPKIRRLFTIGIVINLVYSFVNPLVCMVSYNILLNFYLFTHYMVQTFKINIYSLYAYVVFIVISTLIMTPIPYVLSTLNGGKYDFLLSIFYLIILYGCGFVLLFVFSKIIRGMRLLNAMALAG